MRTYTSIFIALLLSVSCDKGTLDKTEIATAIKKELKNEAKAATKVKKPRWRITYSGDLSGEVEGRLLSVVPGPFTTAIVGGAVTPDRKGKATETLQMSIVENKDEEPRAMIMLTLADGTKCSLPSPEEKAKVKIVDRERKTYHATFEGPLKCGDKRINLKGYVNREP